MCLLIYASPGATPSKKHLRNAGANNPDGFGFAFAVGNDIIRHRTMDLEEAVAKFHEIRAKHTKSHAIFHARITTHGKTNIDNCHPFMVDDGIVLGHNGMLPIEAKDGKSDTRLFAEEWLPSLGVKEVLDDPTEFAELEKFASGSKLCVLSVDSRLDKPVYLVNEKLGHWKNGVWYSNNSYQYEWFSRSATGWGRPYSTTTYYATPARKVEPVEQDIEDGFWFDRESGVWYEWDAKRGWLEILDDEDDVFNYTPTHCYTCKADFGIYGDGLIEGQYCWDCGDCILCGRDYAHCYCGNYGL